MEVSIDGIKKLATTAAIYGIVASVTHKAEQLRTFGKVRYVISGAEHAIGPWRSYKADIQYTPPKKLRSKSLTANKM